jgi:CheY-like chemotaxis protein
MLSSAQIEVHCLDGGKNALTALKEAAAQGRPFDIGVLDIEMPDMDGLSVARQIRASQNGSQRIQLIALSSTLERDAGKCEKAGFNGFLAKPVRRDRLLQMIGYLLVEAPGQQQDEGTEQSSKMYTQYSVREAMKHSIRILLAEDNPVNQKLATMMLGKAGYQVEVVDNGAEAVNKYSAAPSDYDLIFMDIQMPEMDGKQATQQLRELGYQEVPIVAMTAHAFQGDRERCLEVGMNDYITKPIKRETVFDIIKKYVFKKEAS